MDNNHFLVHTICMTYNHEPYVEDALKGFVMQQTTFPAVSVIIDDASTDHTVEVLDCFMKDHFRLDDADAINKETDYGHVAFARHKSNANCFFAVICLKENHYSKAKSKYPYYKEWAKTKYVAICEGDDYWTDPLKLQKQVDFLETHEDYSMCFHAADIRCEGVDASYTGARFMDIEEREYFSTELFEKWIVPTASIVYKNAVVNGRKVSHSEWLTRGDICLVLNCAHTGKVFGMRDVMSVYRLQPNSVSHNSKFRDAEIFRLPNHFRCIYYNFPKVDKKPIVWNISHAYYSRMKAEKSLLNKIRDFVLFVFWDPKWAFQKMMSLIK